MYKLILTGLLTIASTFGFSKGLATCDELGSITPEQYLNLEFSFVQGYPHDFGFTMAAIAWQESKGGIWNLNLQDPSAGMYHTSLKTAVARLEMKDTPFRRNMLAQRLIDDKEFAAAMAIKELQFWYEYHHGNWMKIYSSYNAGFGSNTAYANDIRQTIRTLQKCKFDTYIMTHNTIANR
jgi:hypothetical protein